MKKWLIDYLECPECHGNYTYNETKNKLECKGCKTRIKVNNGIPRFVELSENSDSFGFEWHRHKLTQLDSYSGFNESEAQLKNRIDFPIEELKGKLVLDAGCGMGRYAEIAVKYGAQVICVDLSNAVDSAYGNLHHSPNVSFLQADLFSLPFKKNTFDFIYSFGVLHHTPNAEQAFKAISSFLKNEGKISIFVYASYNKGVVYTSDFWRFFTTKIPYRWLHYITYISVPFYYIYKIPFLGSILKMLFVISMHKKWRWRVLDTFDWYSPKYQSKHTHWEVFRWFEDIGCVDIKIFENEVSVLGKRRGHQIQDKP